MANPFDIKTFVKELTSAPGIYQMLSEKGEVLYVGKARNLKKRVSSYFRSTGLTAKTIAFMRQVHRVDVIVTRTENEALLLESTLIKKFRPRYNVLFRDDKSYPYIYLSDHKEYPRLDFYRGPRRSKGRYFGPYASAGAVRDTLNLLQKLFRIRSCQDEFFSHRSRPCLQYQIHRCSGPCVGLIDPENYQRSLQHAILFLEGKNQAIIDDLVQRMDTASTNLEFEKAAVCRDQIALLQKIQQQQAVVNEKGEVDVLAIATDQSAVCVQVINIREGHLLGSKSFFPTVPDAANKEEIINAFLSQYYLAEHSETNIPRQILLPEKFTEKEWFETALQERACHSVTLITQPRGDRLRWLQLATQNAEKALQQHLAEHSSLVQRFEALQELLTLDSPPERLECFDISHSQGEATVASCVVFDQQGSRKKDYRRFNIEGITGGDDYAAMRNVLSRRYSGLKATEAQFPDVVIIDGGKGQLKQAEEVFAELQISGVILLAIAKGPTRKAGLETLFMSGKTIPLPIQPDSAALHLIQQIRDEAHRFAITGHRGRRAKVRNTSVLETIPGIGSKRRRELLRYFGGLQDLKRASAEDLAKTPGISQELAERIYEALQGV